MTPKDSFSPDTLADRERALLTRVLHLQNRIQRAGDLDPSLLGRDGQIRTMERNVKAIILWLQKGVWRMPHDVRAQVERFLAADWDSLQEFQVIAPPPNVPSFDEATYLDANPDIAWAMRRGLRSAREHWDHHGMFEGRAGGPWLLPISDPDARAGVDRRLVGVNAHGPFRASSGLGTAARSYWKALQSAGVSGVQFDVPSWESTTPRPKLAPLIYRVNFLHQNPDQLVRFVQAYGPHRLRGAYNIGFWVWELAQMPNSWFYYYGFVDEIWAPSQFNRDAFATMTNMPCRTVPYVVEGLEPHLKYGRDYFNIDPNVFVFGMVFDVSSYFDRKNPMAALRAFQKAFGDRKDVLLFIKYSRPEYDPHQVRDLEAEAAECGNVRTYSGLMSHDEIVSLHNCFDCYVSPHRSEGFGLNLAESMYLGRPVIGTGYSGNMQFMRADNSYLTDYRLISVSRRQGPYEIGSTWADPDVDHLASQMRQVFDHPDERARRAALGRKTVLDELSTDAIGKLISSRLNEIGAFEPSPMRHLPIKPAIQKQPLFAAATPDHVIEQVLGWHYRPMISVCIPSRDMDVRWLKKCIESVRTQWYPFWELCILDDGSSVPETLQLLDEYRGLDERIKIRRSDKNLGISEATNRAVEISSGEYVAFIDSDDELTSDALFEVALWLQREPDVDFFYTDEDKIEMDGAYSDPYFKPDFSPDMLRSMMYILHVMVCRKELFWAVGGFRDEFTWSQDFDLSLRVSLHAKKIRHIPKVLYHWRKIPGSAAAVVDAKPQALDAAKRALEAHVKEAGFDATVHEGLAPGTLRIKYKVQGDPPVSLCIISSGKSAEVEGRGYVNLTAHFARSIVEKTEYRNYEIVVASDGPPNRETLEALKGIPYRIVEFPSADSQFNFSKKTNWTVQQAAHELVVVLNEDMEVISSEWLSAMLEFSQQKDVGAVGARLLFSNGEIQHAGVVMGIKDTAAHLFHHWKGDEIGYNAYTHVIRNYSAVTAACIATRKSVWQEVDGLDEQFPVDFNDIDLCLKMVEKGYRIVYTPFASLYHFENMAIERRMQDPRDVERFSRRWRKYLLNDPFFSPNLSRDSLMCQPKMFGHWPRID
jgi:GT2 family glycosyltransferase/glycosyltransferase involved in cell wall biosynthesis